MDELIEARRAALHDVIDDAGRPSKVSAKYGSTPPHMSRLSQPIAQGSNAFRREQGACDWPIRHLPPAGELPRSSRCRPSSRAAAIPDPIRQNKNYTGEKYQ
ncbi:hypothetical protein J2W30_005114 [Variovorax boronicumulans]|uniref:hypothetical protein n=1 Tax=Variovorax boronicumulans TaxID=436515 RepID=UPI002783E973|nr:hypothetical protein [Variovorax boronicumulans]MDP9992339.1 hypothetical protein [Variovorax boronicumulans]MDQ0002490.1 hypothetical protein [Variovorax boronicumulans]MDQ0037338.1 hypothetical protein [Variovorax boronicumulans]MDQ0041891.1 hypothetical protein [Variovorax boronicumulans]